MKAGSSSGIGWVAPLLPGCQLSRLCPSERIVCPTSPLQPAPKAPQLYHIGAILMALEHQGRWP